MVRRRWRRNRIPDALNLALLFGALIIVISPTVIALLLRNVRPSESQPVEAVLHPDRSDGALIAVLVLAGIYRRRAEASGSSVLAFLRIAACRLSSGSARYSAVYLLLHHYLVPTSCAILSR